MNRKNSKLVTRLQTECASRYCFQLIDGCNEVMKNHCCPVTDISSLARHLVFM